MIAAPARISIGDIDHHRAMNTPDTKTTVRKAVTLLSSGFTRSQAAAHIKPTDAAKTAPSTARALALPLIDVNAIVNKIAIAADGTDTASTAASAPAERRTIHPVAAQNARIAVPGVTLAKLCASPY
jgi:hypothetical protein